MPTDDAALLDVLRLSEGMTYKNALAGLDLGGGKTVVVGDPRTDKTPEKFRALGRFIERLNGSYLAAEDVGTTTEDAEQVASQTAHVTGRALEFGGSGDPSPMTAWGVVCGIRAALDERRRSAGARWRACTSPCRAPATSAATSPATCWPRVPASRLPTSTRTGSTRCSSWAPSRRRRRRCTRSSATSTRHARWVPSSGPDTIGRMRCRIVAGAANNQLADDAMGDELKRRGVLYAPDFAINAGGVINIGEELKGPYDAERARTSVERIGDTLRQVFERARSGGVAPHHAAVQMARERIDRARRA